MSEIELIDFLDALDTAVHVIDEDLRVIFFNKSFLEWNRDLKLPTVDVIGKNIFELFPFLPKKVESEYRKVFKTGEKLVTEEYLDIDGQEFYLSTQKIPLLKDGVAVQVITIIKNVTQMKKAENKLIENEILFRGIVENANDAIYIITINGFEFVNHLFEIITGYSKEELTADDFNFLGLIHPDDQAIIKQREQDRKHGKDIPSRYEFRIIDKNEMVKTVEVTTVNLKGGNHPRVMGILRDVTDRVLIENELHQVIEKYSTLLKVLPDLLFVISKDGTYIDFHSSKNEQLAIPPTAIIGKNISDTGFSEEAVQQIRESILTALDTDSLQEVEYELETLSGKGFFNARMIPFTKDRVLSIVRDVTATKAAEEDVKGVNDILMVINKILRHDILNDLQVARSALELYDTECDENLLKKIDQRLSQSVALIHRMRGLETLVRTGKELEPYPIRAIIDETLSNYDVEYSIEGDCVVSVDQAFISVIDNLIENAVVHGETNRIDITLEEQPDGRCKIRFADYGKGISDSIKAMVFEERFSKGPKAGSGLGLFIVRKTIERYGGTIHIEDNYPSGTIITILLRKTPIKNS